MTIHELKAKGTKEDYNSCNAWGFGGCAGKKYTYGRFAMMQGKAYYRHAPSHAVTLFWLDGKREFDDLIFLKELYDYEDNKTS